jgi:hypothetical protein
MTTEYLASPQNRLVPINEERGSSVVNYEERLVRVHAVESIDGVSVPLTVCKRFRANVEDPWCSFDSVRPDIWCDLCAERLGLSAVA